LVFFVLAGAVCGLLKLPDNLLAGVVILSVPLVFAVLTVCNLIWGTTVKQLRDNAQVNLRQRFLKRESQRLGIEFENLAE